MTLPVSSYEELLDRVRSLTRETRQLQRQIDSPLLDCNENERGVNQESQQTVRTPVSKSNGIALEPTNQNISGHPYDKGKDGLSWTKEQGAPPETKEQEETKYDSDKSSKGSIGSRNPMCHSTINIKQCSGNGGGDTGGLSGLSYSYTGSSGGSTGAGEGTLGTKVEMVYNLLSMLGTHDRAEMTNTLLAMSTSPDSCHQMRHSGCLSLLVQLVHASGESNTVRSRAAQALRNMVLCSGDDRRGRREARVLRLLDQLIAYCDLVQDDPSAHTEEAHPGPAIAALMKLSFDEEHRLAMCQLGALYVIARLIQVEASEKMECCITVKRYGGMALTNLTFGDGNNKALLCSMRPFMNSLVAQLNSNSEDLIQVTASVLRNLSWRADAASKQALREVGAVTALMRAAMQGATKEPTLKSVLSALWNLSAHCNANKVDICAVDGALQYLVEMLSYQSASKTLAVVENAGGILRNISSHIAVREDYRKVLRDGNCLVVLLRQLQSASLTVVSNACGTLWNLSARCAADQRALVALGAVPMLTSLAHSKHRMIAMGAGAALKNLLPVRLQHHHQTAAHGGATLLARKKRALEAELNSTLGETCDNIEPGATWETDERDSNTPQVNTKDECEQINRSMKEINIDETTEQPVDYSLKYRETENRNVTVDNDSVNYKMKYSEEKDEKVLNGCFTNAEVNTGGDYAETDLDQLTDFSLRYSEEPLPEGHDSQEPVEGTESRPSEPLTPAEVAASPEKHDTGKGGVLETPLMFSRSSSLGSLSSCEQANDDCQSSVVSEFSRMTSGIMSPSELPDSPTQTVPPSPRTKVPIIPAAVKEEKVSSGGVFDDTVVAFKEESTPAQFSTATSLSDLTFDDEPTDGVDRKELELPVVSEEEDEHVLADCIKSGMQDNRDVIDSIETRRTIPVARVGIPVKTGIPRPSVDEIDGDQLSRATSNSELSLLSDQDDNDNILQQCIESAMPQSAIPKKKPGHHSPGKIPTPSSGVKVPLKSRSIQPPSSRMRQIVAEDEVSVFATEGSPCNFSARSSLSDLTINTRPSRSGPGSPPHEHSSPLSSLEPDVSAGEEGEAVTVVSAASADDPTLGDQDDQALLMQVISSGMHSVSDTMKGSDSWPDDSTLDAPSVNLSAANCTTFNSHRDGVVELETGGVALISHLELESVEPPSNMASITSLGGISMGSGGVASLGCSLDAAQPVSIGYSLDAVQPPSLLDSILSLSSAAPCRETTLLDNIRPPAEMDEVLDLDNSITSVASISSEVIDDLPKCLRTTQDTRYNTYKVVRDRKASDNGPNVELPSCDDVPVNEMKPKDKIKQRRQADKDRFKTRTIHNPVNDFLRLSSVDGSEDGSCSSNGPQGGAEPMEPIEQHHDALGQSIEMASHSTETSSYSVETSVHSGSSDSPSDDPPRPIVVKPPEMKSIRGGGKGSGIPVVRSPVKSAPAGGKRKGANPPPAPLQRQGTFTKEEPSSSIPVPVKKTIASPIKKQSQIPSGIGVGRGRASSLPSKGNSTNGGGAVGGVRASASNQSLKAAAEGKAPAQRWHSNSSLNSASPAPAKPPVSKIASLWKKVDDSKKKQSLAKDTRVWIPPNPSQ